MGLLCVALTACSGDDGGGGTPGTPPEISAGSTVAGPFSGTMTTGTIAATIGSAVAGTAATPVGITGVMTLADGSTVTMTGTIDFDTHAIMLTGTNSAGTFSFTGSSAGGRITGTWTGPTDGGTFSLLNTTSADAQAFCGSFAITGANPAQGSLDLVITADFLAGVAFATDGGGGYIEGTRMGSDLIANVIDDEAITVTVRGTISGSTASGNLFGPLGEDPPAGTTATWQVSLCP